MKYNYIIILLTYYIILYNNSNITYFEWGGVPELINWN